MEALSTENVNRKAKRGYWIDLLRKLNESSLEQKEFAKLEGVKSSQLSKWKSRLRQAEKGNNQKRNESANATDSINFLPLEIEEEKLKEKILPHKVVFHHENGFRIECIEQTPEALLKRALRLLLEVTRC